MTTADLLTACKTALNIAAASTEMDDILTQKVLAVQGYAKNAGVSDTQLATDLGKGTLVIGVTDLWNLNAGEVKFSPVFHVLLTQLACLSEAETETE